MEYNALLRKLPIGIQTFADIRQGNYLYVDKTALVWRIANTGKPYFLSRPRRFGKSLLLSTFETYFKGQKELFEGLAIEKMETEWKKFPVLHLDLNAKKYETPADLIAMLNQALEKWEAVYGNEKKDRSPEERFAYVIERAYEQAGCGVVVLVDEYDKPLLQALDNDALLEDYRKTLKAFYGVLKSADRYLRFAFLTGVTKFSQVSVFSGFNQPKDISMDNHYEALCGVTQVELEHYFAEPIANLAEKFNYTVEEMKDVLKMQYDGYHFGSGLLGVYNPFSLLNAFDMNDIRDYWFASGTPTYLIKLLRHNHEQMDELTGRYYDPSMFVDYKADVEKPLPMIYQSGYLTIKEYDSRRNRYLLDFPNNEVKKGFLTMVAANYFKPQEFEVSNWIVDAVILLEEGETTAFCSALTSFLADIPYDSHGSIKTVEATEKHFQYTFYLILRLLGVYCLLHVEKTQSRGRVDCVLETKDYVYIFEFKLDGTAAEALQQIEDKGYATPYQTDTRKVTAIGVSFSSETMTVEEWEEKTL